MKREYRTIRNQKEFYEMYFSIQEKSWASQGSFQLTSQLKDSPTQVKSRPTCLVHLCLREQLRELSLLMSSLFFEICSQKCSSQ
jgi:hypothetical protein